MRIEQARVSSAIKGFTKNFLKKYKLRGYSDVNKPAIFFGCYSYNSVDIPAVLRHQSLAVVIWGGSDALRLSRPAYRAKYAAILRRKHTYFIAISKHISKDMLDANIPHVYLPVCPTAFSMFKPTPLGKKVYLYSSHAYGWKYGANLIPQLRKRLPNVKFLSGFATAPNHHPGVTMPAIYSQCFMGVRLTPHDGLSNTVIELGLMGRKCVWNGWLSNAIPWRDVKEVARAVLREQKGITTTSLRQLEKVAREVKRDLILPDGWLTTEFYRKLERRGRYDGVKVR